MKDQTKGIVYMLVSNLSFCVMAALVKSSPQIDDSLKVFFRFALGLAILGTLAMFNKIKLQFIKSRILFIRGLVGSLAVFLFFMSITKLGVGKGTVIIYSYPIFASIFSAIFLKEKVAAIKWIFIALAFFGIYILSSAKIGDFSFGLYEGLAILGAICSATAVTLVKKLHDTDNSIAIFFAQVMVGFWIFIYPANLNLAGNSGNDIFILFIIGLVSVVGQLFMTEGYRFVNVTTGSVMHLLLPVLNLFVGFLIFNETLGIKEVTGATLVILSCYLVINWNWLHRKFNASI